MKTAIRQRTQLIFISISIIIILSTSISHHFSQFREELFHEYIVDISKPLTTMIVDKIKHEMIKNKSCKFSPPFQDTTISTSIENIYIMNNSGKIISSNDPAALDSVIMDLPLSLHSMNNDLNFHYHSDNSHIVTIYSPIKNTEKCYECHTSSNKNLGYVGLVFNFKSQNKLEKSLVVYDFLSIGFIFFAFFIVIIFFHRRYFQDPYDRINSGIRDIEKGNLNTQIHINQKCEMQKLAESINLMTKKLDKAQIELKVIHKKEMVRVGQLALVGELAASVAHEIKNPISGIRNALEIILDQNQDLQEKEIFLEMQIQAQRVFKTINDLMCFAKPKKPIFKKIAIHDVLDESIKLYELQIQKKGIEIFKDYDSDISHIHADANLLKTVFTNILLNAYHACPANNGKIYLETRVEFMTDQIIIIFYNNGKNIPDDNLEKIFEPFFTTKAKGTGLGLSLSKSIVEKHNGQIGAKNTDESGTGFFIYLPINDIKTRSGGIQ